MFQKEHCEFTKDWNKEAIQEEPTTPSAECEVFAIIDSVGRNIVLWLFQLRAPENRIKINLHQCVYRGFAVCWLMLVEIH